MNFADAFLDEGIEPPPTDDEFLLTCNCGLDQRLAAMDRDEDFDGLVLYECTRCGNSIVGIMSETAATDLWMSAAGMTRRTEVGGHRRNGYVIGSKVDVGLHPAGEDAAVVLVPATPNFFAALRNL